MRVVFLGTPAAAVPALIAVHDAGHEVSLVITRPDRPRGRSGRPAPPPVKQQAAMLGLPVLQPMKVRNAEFRERLAELSPELLVVVAYGRILPAPVLNLATHGAINLHFSLLPRYRGAAPVQWALARGEAVTGVSTMQLNEGLDEGPILLKEEIPIEPGEHAPELAERLAEVGARLLVQTIRRIGHGTLTPIEQDPDAATYAPMLSREDGELDPALDAREVEGRIRGFDPWPGAWLRRGRKRVRLVQARALPHSGFAQPPGTLIAGTDPDEPTLVCGGGSGLALSRVQPEGRRVVSARDAINGRQLVLGERLVGPSGGESDGGAPC